MFLNVDQLEKQLDNKEFQEIGSMASFKVLETQFQMFINSQIYLNDEYIVMTRNYFLEYTRLDILEFRDTLIQNMDYVKKSIEKRPLHKMEYDSRVNERLMQTTEEKVDSSKALDASLVIIESNGTESQEQDTSSRSGNDAHVNNADIIPIYNEEPMDEVDQNAEQCHDIRPLPAKLTDNMTPKLSDQSLELKSDQASGSHGMTSVYTSVQASFLSNGLWIYNRSDSEFKTSAMNRQVVRLGINPMIQPEPEDLPKDNPKLEIAVLSACALVSTRNRPQQQVPPNIEPFNLEEPLENQAPPVVTMADQRTMAQLLQAPTEGYEDAIVVPAITADNFELKHGLLTLVQNKPFCGLDKEDPHAHIRYFNKITSTLKFPNVPNTSIKLMLFPFSLEGAARIWLEKEPPRSIFTWDDLVSKFINQFFPPSKTTNLRNEITSFRQRFDESFSEAWDRFKDLLRACPHHGFSELHQLDTFYNALNSNDQDSLNSAAGDMVRALLLDKKNQSQAPATVKAVEESCVTYGGAHSYRNCPATDSNVYRDNIQVYVSQAVAVNYNQGNIGYHPPMVANQIRPPGFPPIQNNQRNNQNRYNQNWGNNYNQVPINQPPAYQAPTPQTQGVSKDDFQNYVKANDAVTKNMQDQNQTMQNQLTNLTEMLTKFMNANSASTSGSGSLPSNTVANPRGDMKAITTQSRVSYDGPQVPPPPSSLPKVVEEVTKDTVHPSTKNIQPPEVQTQIDEPVVAPRTKTGP
ncbi:reverse transcriptase domain-containing protein [Tanacetum coccineum]|uniref:Reverse transcriptase domain-containing protein n=1 Tax=Tanacetum coccineum TaxID=301880 RepID=A0ABQ5GFM1_9ASTR